MATVRDFTDEAKERLSKAIQAAEDQDTHWYNYVGDWFHDWVISDDIADYNSDIVSFHEAIVDKKNTTQEQLNAIFSAVYEVEDTFKQKFLEQKNLLSDAAVTFSKVAEALNPVPVDGGKFLLIRSPAEVQLAMSDTAGPLIQGLMESMKNPDGSYDWETIEELLQSDPEDLSGAEIAALALLSMQMEDPSDMETFIQLSYVYVEDIDAEGNPYNQRFQPSQTFVAVALTGQTFATALAESTLYSGLPANQWGVSEEQVNSYLMRMGILMDVAEFGAVAVDTSGFLDPETMRLTDRDMRGPVQISYTDSGYLLDIATQVIEGDPRMYAGYPEAVQVEGFAPPQGPTKLEDRARQLTTRYLVNELPSGGALGAFLNGGKGWVIGKAFGAMIAAAGIVGVPATLAAAAFSIGKSTIGTLIKNAETTREHGYMIDAGNRLDAWAVLGYDVQFSMLNGNQLSPRFISPPSPCDEYITQLLFNEACTEGGPYTTEQITQVMLNGYDIAAEPPMSYIPKEMDAAEMQRLGITQAQQQEILNAACNDDIKEDRSRLEERLSLLLEDNYTSFGGKTSLDALTPAEAARLVAMAE